MPKKILKIPKQLQKNKLNVNDLPKKVKKDNCVRVRKLVKPLIITDIDEDQESIHSKSSSPSPSPRPSICLDAQEAEEEHILKILVIGDSTVGKTSFIQRYVQNKFICDYKSTVGVDFSTKILYTKKYNNQPIKLQFWDIAGQDRYICMTRAYYRNAHGCIIMFDLTNPGSFKNVVNWKNDLDSKCILETGDLLPCLLLASKCDLPGREVEMNEIESLCNRYNFIGWIEVSSKNHLMIEDSVNFLVDKIMCWKIFSSQFQMIKPQSHKNNIKLGEESDDNNNNANGRVNKPYIPTCMC